MEWAATIPAWALSLMVFVLRVCDVTLGTVRTVAIVKGYLSMAVVLGFFELMVWVLAIRQVISRRDESSGEPRLRLRPVPHSTGWRAVFKKK
jgi:uncharacterized protein YebE (UPF0316 family)